MPFGFTIELRAADGRRQMTFGVTGSLDGLTSTCRAVTSPEHGNGRRAE